MEYTLDLENIKEIVLLALKEDIGRGDLTSRLFVPEGSESEGIFLSQEKGIVAGLPVAEYVLLQIDRELQFTVHIEEGEEIDKGTKIASVKGSTLSILAAERLVLNFLQRLSGIATTTSKFVEKVKGHHARIMDTRKTTPGLRYLERYAVRVGGGHNHRMGLYDQILVKDNHLKILETDHHGAQCRDLLKEDGASPIQRLVQRARELTENKILIEVEVEDIGFIKEVLAAGVDIIMLDNMDPSEMVKAVKMVKEYDEANKTLDKHTLTEASGGISLENVEAYAKTGVDRISVGRITHSASALDISFELSS